MISLRCLLLEDDKEEVSVWRSYVDRWAGRNNLGQLRYFSDEEQAQSFARGQIAGPHLGGPTPKKRAKRREKIQKYDVTPVTYVDREATQ